MEPMTITELIKMLQRQASEYESALGGRAVGIRWCVNRIADNRARLEAKPKLRFREVPQFVDTYVMLGVDGEKLQVANSLYNKPIYFKGNKQACIAFAIDLGMEAEFIGGDDGE